MSPPSYRLEFRPSHAAVKPDAASSAIVRKPHPHGRSLAFVNAVKAKHGQAYVDSWLVGGTNVLFGEAVIYTTGAGHDRLMVDCWKIAEEIGVSIAVDPTVRAALAKSQSASPHGPKLRKGTAFAADPPSL